MLDYFTVFNIIKNALLCEERHYDNWQLDVHAFELVAVIIQGVINKSCTFLGI